MSDQILNKGAVMVIDQFQVVGADEVLLRRARDYKYFINLNVKIPAIFAIDSKNSR